MFWEREEWKDTKKKDLSIAPIPPSKRVCVSTVSGDIKPFESPVTEAELGIYDR